MVTYRDVQPIGHQSVIFSAEHYTDICCMLTGGIKISVVANFSRQAHNNIVHRCEYYLLQFLIITQHRILITKRSLQHGAYLFPCLSSKSHKSIQTGPVEYFFITKNSLLKVALFFKYRKIDNIIAYSGAANRL